MMVEIPDLAGLAAPDNRREAAVYIGGLSLLAAVVTGGVFVSEYASSANSIGEVWSAMPGIVTIGLPVSALLVVACIVIYTADVIHERRMRRRVGVRPRSGEGA
jgi:membrane protein implicated in regulation of membrane protease activity